MGPDLTSPTTPGPEAAPKEGAAIAPDSAEQGLINALQQVGYEAKAAHAIARSLSQLQLGASQHMEQPGFLLCPVPFLAALYAASTHRTHAPLAASAATLENSASSLPAFPAPIPAPLPLAGSGGGAQGGPPGLITVAGAESEPPAPPTPVKAYHLRLHGSLGRGGHVLFINHSIPVELQLNQFLLMLALCCHALCQDGRPAPCPVLGGDYLKAERVLKFIDALRRSEPGLRNLPVLTAQEVHHAKWGVTKRLVKNGVDASLFESLRGSGYRLDIDPSAIVIVLCDDDEEDQTWGVK